MTVPPQRPTGVTVLAILAFIGAACAVGFGLMTLALAGLAGAGAAAGGSMGGMAIIAGFGLLGSIFLFGMGALSIVVGIGLLRLRNWARLTTIVLSAIGVLMSVPGLFLSLMAFEVFSLVGQLIPVAINAVIVWYLLQPHVVAAFSGRQAAAAAQY